MPTTLELHNAMAELKTRLTNAEQWSILLEQHAPTQVNGLISVRGHIKAAIHQLERAIYENAGLDH